MVRLFHLNKHSLNATFVVMEMVGYFHYLCL